MGSRLNAFRIIRRENGAGAKRAFQSSLQSQRDCVLQPRVARNELPWVGGREFGNPNGVVALLGRRAATPLGLLVHGPFSQGSSFLATLGWRPESRWDSTLEFPKGSRTDLRNSQGLMPEVVPLSLAPGFSRVSEVLGMGNRFNGFPHVAREAAEAAAVILASYTRLKPGANEREANDLAADMRRRIGRRGCASASSRRRLRERRCGRAARAPGWLVETNFP